MFSFFFVGAALNIYQCIVQLMALEVFATISGTLIAKIISIFLGPVGSIWGWIGLFA